MTLLFFMHIFRKAGEDEQKSFTNIWTARIPGGARGFLRKNSEMQPVPADET